MDDRTQRRLIVWSIIVCIILVVGSCAGEVVEAFSEGGDDVELEDDD